MSQMTKLQGRPLVGRTVVVYAREIDNREHRSEPVPFYGRVIGIGRVVRGHKSPQALILRTTEPDGAEDITVITFGRVSRVLDWASEVLLFTDRRRR